MIDVKMIQQVLVSDAMYWIAARETRYSKYGTMERGDDQIVLIAIPDDIPRGMQYEEILLKDVERAGDVPIEKNIFINNDYPPFQLGLSLKDFYLMFPITCDVKAFLDKAFELKTNDIWDYKGIICDK